MEVSYAGAGRILPGPKAPAYCSDLLEEFLGAMDRIESETRDGFMRRPPPENEPVSITLMKVSMAVKRSIGSFLRGMYSNPDASRRWPREPTTSSHPETLVGADRPFFTTRERLDNIQSLSHAVLD